MWVAKGKLGYPRIFYKKPYRCAGQYLFSEKDIEENKWNDNKGYPVDINFPLDYNDGPIEVEIIIKNK